MSERILAVGKSGKERMIPARWLDLDLGFKVPPSRSEEQPTPVKSIEPDAYVPEAVEPTVEPLDTKEEPHGSNAG